MDRAPSSTAPEASGFKDHQAKSDLRGQGARLGGRNKNEDGGKDHRDGSSGTSERARKGQPRTREQVEERARRMREDPEYYEETIVEQQKEEDQEHARRGKGKRRVIYLPEPRRGPGALGRVFGVPGW